MSKFALQHILLAVFAAALLLAGQSLHAQNKYDILARALQPYGALFYSKATTKAMQAEVILREGPPAATEILNQPVRISLQIPDKLRVETLDPQHRIVFCRDGQSVWAYPRDFATTVVSAGRSTNAGTRIPDFRLPLNDQEIVFIPALFQILRFASGSDSNAKSLWIMDFRLVPELAQAMKCDNWVASVVINQDDFQLRRLRVESGSYTAKFDVLATRFEKALPTETWKAGSELANGATPIPPECFGSALGKISATAIPR